VSQNEVAEVHEELQEEEEEVRQEEVLEVAEAAVVVLVEVSAEVLAEVLAEIVVAGVDPEAAFLVEEATEAGFVVAEVVAVVIVVHSHTQYIISAILMREII